MRRQDFYYELPEELIAKAPPEMRRSSRLLCLDGVTGELQDRRFADILALVRPGDLMVFNSRRYLHGRTAFTVPVDSKGRSTA